MIEKQKNIEIFYCYARKDQKLVEELEKHLFTLNKRELNIKWAFREVTARKEWVETFDKSISRASIILLLLSPDFMASSYLRSKDMEKAFERQQAENIHIIPIYLRPINYTNSKIDHLKFLPENGKPVTSWRNRDEAFLDISLGIKNVIEEIERTKEASRQNDNDTLPEKAEDEISKTTDLVTAATDVYDTVPIVRPIPEAANKMELASPTIERSTYLFSEYAETSKKKRNKQPGRNRSRKGPSPFDQLLPLFNTTSPTMELVSSRRKEIDDYDDARDKAQRRLINDQPRAALDILEDIDLGSIPSQQRWRLTALRGHCYFGLGKFLPARKEYNDALQEKPIIVPKEQIQEEGMLYLRAAETNRELGNLIEATDLYHTALAHMNTRTQVGYLAEAHWGLALVLFEQINATNDNHADLNDQQKQLLDEAFRHAEYARQLYDISGDDLNATSITCDIALFEQTTGDLENASKHLKEVIDSWTPMLQQKAGSTKENHKRFREYNNIVSAASCYLAGIEIKMHQYENALYNIKIAQETGEKSYTIRKGEAAMMLGSVLEARNLNDPDVEKAFQQAIDILSKTDLLGAQAHAHDLLGRHFLKIGKVEMGEKELDKARKISQTAMFSY